MKSYILTLMLTLGACMQTTTQQPPNRLAMFDAAPAGQMRSFTAASTPVRRTTRSNSQIARDFLDLTFQMESGRAIPTFTRFEGPISVRLTGQTNQTMSRDLGALLARLRSEAGLNIAQTASPDASITIEAVPRATLRRAVPRAACFVVPRVGSWAEYLRMRSRGTVDWTTVKQRHHAAIFLPADAAPQEIRDCLHEELAQALGPLNDLYRLPQSVFNDDNIHAVLTGFDMLILRATYSSDLRNGMPRAEVARRLPSILARLNPAGQSAGLAAEPSTSRAWITAMETALSIRGGTGARMSAANRAMALTDVTGLTGVRRGFAHYAYARLQVRSNPSAALQSFTKAHQIFSQSSETEIHSAFSAAQLAAFALSSNNPQQVLQLVDPAIVTAKRHENAALLATLKMFRSEALELMGRENEATRERLDSFAWGRYGFGSDRNVQARYDEIAALNPKR